MNPLRVLLLLLPAILLPQTAGAFSTTNVQLLYGSGFHDPYYGNNTTDGNMTTVTLEHLSTFDYGDNYFFVDLLSGNFTGFTGTPTGSHSRIYSEWNPRLSLSKISGHDLSTGIIRDLFISAQLNRDGEGFHAELIGGAIDFNLPGFSVASAHLFWRKDNFNRPTWQTTLVWLLPLDEWFQFTGFADIYGSDNNGTEIGTQPQLLFDLGRLLDSPGHLQAGIEWYLHRNRNLHSSVAQAMVKWAW